MSDVVAALFSSQVLGFRDEGGQRNLFFIAGYPAQLCSCLHRDFAPLEM